MLIIQNFYDACKNNGQDKFSSWKGTRRFTDHQLQPKVVSSHMLGSGQAGDQDSTTSLLTLNSILLLHMLGRGPGGSTPFPATLELFC